MLRLSWAVTTPVQVEVELGCDNRKKEMQEYRKELRKGEGEGDRKEERRGERKGERK